MTVHCITGVIIMSIKVRYFASLQEAVGRSEANIDSDESLTAREIWRRLNPGRDLPDNVLAAVDLDYVSLDAEVRDGQELAFFPPVTGG